MGLPQRWALPGRALKRTSPGWILDIFRRIRYQLFLTAAVPVPVLLGMRCGSLRLYSSAATLSHFLHELQAASGVLRPSVQPTFESTLY